MVYIKKKKLLVELILFLIILPFLLIRFLSPSKFEFSPDSAHNVKVEITNMKSMGDEAPNNRATFANVTIGKNEYGIIIDGESNYCDFFLRIYCNDTEYKAALTLGINAAPNWKIASYGEKIDLSIDSSCDCVGTIIISTID